MKKRIVSAACAGLLALGCIGIPVSADIAGAETSLISETYTSGDYKYEILSDNTAKLTKYLGTGGRITIPDNIDGHEVTFIAEYAFKNNTNITEITMPDTITTLDNWCFASCSNITKVKLSNNLTKIPNCCFHSCSSLESISIPNSVKTIGTMAFEYCYSLETVNFSNGQKVIDTWAFHSCKSLNNVVLPDSMTTLELYSFQSCTSLTKITIPKSVTSIRYETFDSISNIVTIYCYKDSVAHQYAEKNKIKYVLLDKAPSKKSISSATVSVSNVYYTGKALKPKTTVKLDGKTLTEGTDYTASYSGNTKVGKASVKVTGKGNYTGSKSKSFIIKPGKVKLTKVTSPKKKQIKVTWKKDSQASGYQVTIATNRKFTAGKKSYYVTKNGTVNKKYKLKSGTKYFVKVRAYKKIDGKKYFGKFSNVKSVKCK